jgi:hypothetical protein
MAKLKEPGFGKRAWLHVFDWMRQAMRPSANGAAFLTYTRSSNYDKLSREDLERVVEARGWATVLPDGRRAITDAGRAAIGEVARVTDVAWEPGPAEARSTLSEFYRSAARPTQGEQEK